ncbi:MAG: hypothetical protein HUU20_02705 [Pirellulales bacterium]|nr:hypothetical protein [Pirellulales bacterium]
MFRQVYEDGAFGRVIDYAQPPKVALGKAESEWVEGLLRNSRHRQ